MAAKSQAKAPPFSRRVAAEGLGAFFLFACVIGSGIMAQNLSGGNDAIALLGNLPGIRSRPARSSSC